MGSSQTKENRKPTSERVVVGLKNKVRFLQAEVNEIMSIREEEKKFYEKELMAFGHKQAGWKREGKKLKEEIKKLREALNENSKCPRSVEGKQFGRRDETVEKWKELYFSVKVELDDLISRTHQEERACWMMEGEDASLELNKELGVKEEKIEVLQAMLVSLEDEVFKRDREMDILRQSLRIMSYKKMQKLSFI